MLARFAFVLAGVAGCATAASDVEQGPTYLALGDSVAFGYSPLVDLNTTEVTGYPEQLAADRGYDITNLACPGEASGGFMSTTGADNHCRENRQMYPLHVDYDGTQLRAAVEYLERSKPDLVTIDLGANDIFLLDDICHRDITCILQNFVATLTAYDNNMSFIFTELRRVYDGPLIGLSIYSPYANDATADYALEKINGALAAKVEHFGGTLADGFTAFKTASNGDPCAAGLLIPLPEGGCDVHPTAAGAKVLADAIEASLR